MALTILSYYSRSSVHTSLCPTLARAPSSTSNSLVVSESSRIARRNLSKLRHSHPSFDRRVRSTRFFNLLAQRLLMNSATQERKAVTAV